MPNEARWQYRNTDTAEGVGIHENGGYGKTV